MSPSLPEILVLLRAALAREYPWFQPGRDVVIMDPQGHEGIKLPMPPVTTAPQPKQEAVLLDLAGRGLSPIEEAIVRYLAGKGWQTGQQIADGTGYRKNNTLNTILSNLAETPLVESSNRHGYRLRTVSTDADDDS